ncbi:hypothetical protein FGX01_01015, partial [Xylella fastidiosa subsp. multiplex]|nr:hypothetical protein [Xylella fastidiosa subsp. multiplex]
MNDPEIRAQELFLLGQIHGLVSAPKAAARCSTARRRLSSASKRASTASMRLFCRSWPSLSADTRP